MKTAITNWSFHREIGAGRMDVPKFIAEAKRLGYEAVELLYLWTQTPEQIKEARNVAEDQGLKICCYDVSNNFCVTGDDFIKQVDVVRKGIDTAAELGAPALRVFSGNETKGLTYETARGMIVEGFYRVAPEAERAGVTLALENHGRLAAKSEQVMRIIKSVGSPAMKSCFDTGNFMIGDDDSVSAARSLAQYVAHVHVKDLSWKKVTGEPPVVYLSNSGKKLRFESLGEGQINLSKIIKILKNAGYNGYLSLEYEAADVEPEGVAKSTQHLMRLAGRE